MEKNKIPRRKALQHIALGATGILALPSLVSIAENKYDYVIENGSVFSNGNLVKKNVGIKGERIQVSEEPLTGLQIIDATGYIVSPGFIDILGDNSADPKSSYKLFEKYKLTDGVTTVLQMHGGVRSPQSFHSYFDQVPHYTNYGVSVKVMLIRYAYKDWNLRFKAVEKALDEGGLGVSHSIEYQPTSYEELLGYAKLARKYDRPFFLHLRYSSKEKELEGVKEAVQLARDTGARIHIAHLHSTGGTFHMEEALELIRDANASGQEISTCVYPYSYWATYLHSTRFGPGWQERYGLSYEDLTVVGTGEQLTATRFNTLRKQFGVLVAVPEGTMPFESTIDLALKEDFCLIGSDGGIEKEPKANSHPRGAGCFATAIRHGLRIGLSMEKILSKMTNQPGKLLRPVLDQRGDILNGNIADLTIFDPQSIHGNASVSNPNQFSSGIEYVFVNGKLTYDKSNLKTEGKPIISH